MPEVSIIIPVHNRSVFLRDAIESCFAQTHHDFEIVVVDDGSTEPVQKVLNDIPLDRRSTATLRYVSQPHLGANAARNRGVQEASCQFVQFLDSDDLLHPSKLAIQTAVLLDSPATDMVFALDEYFRTIPGDVGLLWNAPDGRPHLDRFLWDDPVWSTVSPLWRRATLERTGGWDETLICWQDWEFHIRALCRNLEIAHVPRVLAYLREHPELRSTNLDTATGREESKCRAADAVANELESASLLTSRRKDALAVFLLDVAENLANASAPSLSRTALRRARTYSSTFSLEVACRLMLVASFLPQVPGIGQRKPLGLVHRLAKRLRLIPASNSSWRTLVRDRKSGPGSLVRAKTATVS